MSTDEIKIEVNNRCDNYKLCNNLLPSWWSEYKHRNICTGCDIRFGNILQFKNLEECPICYEENQEGVHFPNCKHFICIDCFKRSWYTQILDYPEFPYPQLRETYVQNSDEIDFDDYPLIQEWIEIVEAIDDLQQERYEQEKYLRKCPFCRK